MTDAPRTEMSGVFFFFMKLFFLFPVLLLPFAVAADPVPEKDPLRQKSLSGDKAAMFKLGDEYFYGTKERLRNATLAAYWYRKAAENGVPEAMYNYALCLNQGLGVDRNRFDAYQWMSKAAEAGLKNARFQLILMDLKGIPADPERKIPAKPPLPSYAISQMEMLADEKYIPAELFYAEYLLRRKAPEETGKAIKILKRLTSLPEPPPEALRMLADCCYDGRGVRQSASEMLRLLRLAAKQGDSEALGKLAFCYEYGRGTGVDLKKAENLYRLSAERGNAMSQFKYAEFLANGTVSKNPDIHKALPWYRKAIEQKNPQAAFRLGVFYLEGIGVKKNERKAAEHFFEAAKQNYARAQYNLGCMYAAGTGELVKDESAAVYWFTLAAKGGDATAQRVLGVRYLEGRGVKRSLTHGENLLREAAKNGDLEAAGILRRQSFRNDW